MRQPATIFCLVLAQLLAGCTVAPRGEHAPSAWRASPSFDQRRPNFIVIHHTSDDNVDQALQTLTDPERRVSAHYLIARDGTRYQLVDEAARAWHAGESQWGANTDLNSTSLGIELDNNGDEPFAAPQIESLLLLLADLQQRYAIPAANILGHADVAPRRKVDPNRFFPWQELARHGFGLWCEQPVEPPPPGFDSTLALAALGYDVADPLAATRAFKRHFLPAAQEEKVSKLDESEQRLLYCLIRTKIAAPN